MPVLSNGKHEVFCREFIRYNNRSLAYAIAYKGNTETTTSTASNGLRLFKEDHIQDRIKELRDEVFDQFDLTAQLEMLNEASLSRDVTDMMGDVIDDHGNIDQPARKELSKEFREP